MIAKDFQEATANRIIELFKTQHNRVLLADEVGLGKTIVAKTVVEKTGKLRRESGDQQYDVVYICSNAGIAEQNCSKLGIPEENRVRISEGRLSMQHLMLAESETRGNVRLIPMTPATSFQMRSGVGTGYERALAYLLMDICHVPGGYSEELSIFMRTYFIGVKKTWPERIEYERQRINNLKNRKEYIRRMKELLEEHMDEKLGSDLKSVCRKIRRNRDTIKDDARIDHIIPWREQKSLINRIRFVFATISLQMLNPDLVIMDEFQRFRDLIEIDDNDQSDEAMLSRKFLKGNSKSYVLLLSATPYKPYSTLAELADGEESHLEGFMRVMDFLAADKEENKEFHRVWDDYTKHLSEITTENLSVLIASKTEAESALYNHVCRTERRDSGIISTEKAKEMSLSDLSKEDITSYIEMQKTMQTMGYGNFPIDYVKSAPFLMSFMNYKVKDKIDNFLDGPEGSISPEERTKLINEMSIEFLKRSDINDYRELPNANARLRSLFHEAFNTGKDNAGSPELLLWIPPSNPYYDCGEDSLFEKCKGYSKTLVFSSWEMVPRVISTLTSYESERLVNRRIIHKSAEQQTYYALPEEADFDDDENPKKNKSKRGKTRFLIREQRELVDYPSDWLASKYDGERFYNFHINDVRMRVRESIETDLQDKLLKYNLPHGTMGANRLLALLKFMDGRSTELPERYPLDEDIDILVNMAIGSPAMCLYRALNDISDKEQRFGMAKDCCDKSFVSMFNRPESRSIMNAIYQNEEGNEEERHYEQVFSYCVDGNFQSMLDEYKFALELDREEFVKAIDESFLQTANLPYNSREFYKASFTAQPMNRPPRLRVHFAAGYFDAKVSETMIQRVNGVRKAFNSPFRPFVLATTSVGQEGLDFHLYCRKVMHWNLPSNPIDIEQREGRVNRYLCHAIRQNVAANTPDYDWKEKFDKTRKEYGQNASEIVPYWCLPDNYPFKYQIERIVPMYPFSQDRTKYNRLINVLALYRLTLGQPRQEEMISILHREDLSAEQIDELCFDLSPYDRCFK